MKIIVHKGAQEIGGTCIELSHEGTTILLDIGEPLKKDSKPPDLTGVKPDAVIVSHPHQDHYGLIGRVDDAVPVYIGDCARRLIEATRTFQRKPLFKKPFLPIKDKVSFPVGSFTITPFLVDHSAVDAFALLAEAGGKRVLYSGDFRGHGRKSKLFQAMVKHPPKNIDVLFMEGTMLGRDNLAYPDEQAVEEAIYRTIKGSPDPTFLIASPQNLDRIVSAYRACIRAGKIMVVDQYAAWVLEQIRTISGKTPFLGAKREDPRRAGQAFENVKVLCLGRYKTIIEQNAAYFGKSFLLALDKHEVKLYTVIQHPEKYLQVGGIRSAKAIEKSKGHGHVNVIYSQYSGYLEGDYLETSDNRLMASFRHDPQVTFAPIHTSGHAVIEDLQKFAAAIKPRNIHPIHTEHAELYSKIFKEFHVIEAKDGNEFEI